MSIFRRNAAPVLEKTKAALATAEAEAARLEAERVAKLAEPDDSFVPVLALERKIEDQRRIAAVCRARIVTLERLAAEEDLARREKERQDGIATIIAPKLARIDQLADTAEKAFSRFCESQAGLLAAAKEVNEAWPASVPRPRYAYYFSLSEVERRVATAMDRAARNGVQDGASIAAGFADTVLRATARYLDTLRSVPLPGAPVIEPETPADAEAA